MTKKKFKIECPLCEECFESDEYEGLFQLFDAHIRDEHTDDILMEWIDNAFDENVEKEEE